MAKKEIEFKFERGTKNTYRFQEAGDNPIIGTLYVKKLSSRKNFTRVLRA
ncbi:MAG: hypothetical protein M1496_02225 [Candidatus Thermoplasmatota archaeon]|jgi:hypothetical protein|nr:hypothetical protein [Candidatus Thermoplasmatota archaeon]